MTDMKQISWEGEIWNIAGIGATDEESQKIWVHLSSTTRFRQQKNGKVPVQMLDQLPIDIVRAA
jgi:hypothetical protein